MAKLTLNELESHLWGAANILRGKIDSSDYKHYIFGLLFYKRICDVWKLNIHHKGLLKDYLYWALAQITKQVESDDHGASALVHMKMSEIEKFHVPLPPKKEQRQIEKVFLTFDHKITAQVKELEVLQQMKKGLMQDLLTGKVRVKV